MPAISHVKAERDGLYNVTNSELPVLLQKLENMGRRLAAIKWRLEGLMDRECYKERDCEHQSDKNQVVYSNLRTA